MNSALINLKPFSFAASNSRGSSLVLNGRCHARTPLRGFRITASPANTVRVCNRKRQTAARASADTVAVASSSEGIKPAILLSEKALKHLNKMRAEKNEDLCLRIGVRQGGCSGMSYIMDFEQKANTRPDDSVIDCDGFRIVCDPKSLLFLYGMQLDYSDALIGGGFSFTNPNATSTCGCGKSFAA